MTKFYGFPVNTTATQYLWRASVIIGLALWAAIGSASAQVSLGAAQNVTILGGTTITNTGATLVLGNIALSPGSSVTGFPPGMVSGGTIHINDALAVQAHADAFTAYTQLAGQVPTTDLTGMDLGGLMLTPGIYHYNTSAQLTGTLTLNTGGDPNATFVFQVGTTLITASNSAVVLLGSTPNIFWQVGTSATIGNDSIFNGNILADQSITINSGASLGDGKALSINGAVTLDTNSVNLGGAAGLVPGGAFWNGGMSALWSGVNWSPDATGATSTVLPPGADVVFSVTGIAPQNRDTILDVPVTISSLTVNDPVAVTISGPGLLAVFGGGVSRGITVNGGAGLTTINSNVELSGLSQAITVNNAAGLVINGAVSGAIGLTKEGAGSLSLTGANTYTGGTAINLGTLAVGNPAALGIGAVTNNATLQTTAATSAAPAISINVTGAFTQTATGTLRLEVVTNQGGPTTQAAAGVNYDTLAATGVAAVDGILQLDFKTAAIRGQRFQVVSSAASNVTGAFDAPANLTGAVSPGIIPITTYNNSFGGTYAANSVVVTLFQRFATFPGLTPNQIAVATNVDNFVTGAFSANNNNVQNTPGANDFFNNIVTGLTLASLAPATLGQALNELSPQRFQILRNIAFDNYAFDVQGLDNYHARVRDGQVGLDATGFAINDSALGPELSRVRGRLLAWSPRIEPGLLSDASSSAPYGVRMTDPKDAKEIQESVPLNRWNAFIDGGATLGELEHNSDITHSNYTTGKVRGGADYGVMPELRVGGLFGYNHTDAELDHEGSTADVDSFTPGLYAAWANKAGFYANALATYTRNDYSTDRKIIIPGVNRTASGSTSGDQFGGNLDGGYEFRKGNWVFGPNVGASYVNLGIESFAESGAGAANLNVGHQSAQSLRSRLGGTLRYLGKIGSIKVTPHISAFWQHEFLDNERLITSAFQGIPAGNFAIQTTQGDKDSALLGAGLDAELTPNITLFVDYGTEVGGSSYFGQSATAGVKFAF